MKNSLFVMVLLSILLSACTDEDNIEVIDLQNNSLKNVDTMNFEEAKVYFSEDEVDLLTKLQDECGSLSFFKVEEKQREVIQPLNVLNVDRLLLLKKHFIETPTNDAVSNYTEFRPNSIKTRSENGSIGSYTEFIDSYKALTGTVKLYAYFGYLKENGKLELLSFDTGITREGVMLPVFWSNHGSAAKVRYNSIDYNVVGAIVGRLEGAGGVGTDVVLKYVSKSGSVNL